MNGHRSFSWARLIVWLMFTCIVASACSPQPGSVNVLSGVSLAPNQTPALGAPLSFILSGVGKCNSVSIDWGDGVTEVFIYGLGGIPIDLSGSDASAIASRTITHTFSGWGGGKTVTVDGTVNGTVQCLGRVNTRFQIPPVQLFSGWDTHAPAGTSGFCQSVASPAYPGMIPRMLVHITLSMVNGKPIDFGCSFGACAFDANGKNGTPPSPGFPYPDMRAYSVVYIVGTQMVQGGLDTQFTTTNSGSLMFCLNDGDFDLTNNKGGFDIAIGVDELGP